MCCDQLFWKHPTVSPHEHIAAKLVGQPPLSKPPMTLSSLHYDVWYREFEVIITLIMLVCCRVSVMVSTFSILVSFLIMFKCLIINPPHVQRIIEEIREGQYTATDEPPRLVSALGAIPKSSQGVCFIHDCSGPHGCVVNGFCPLPGGKGLVSLPGWCWTIITTRALQCKSWFEESISQFHASNFPFTGLSCIFFLSWWPSFYV